MGTSRPGLPILFIKLNKEAEEDFITIIVAGGCLFF